jgi:hypothetical protein
MQAVVLFLLYGVTIVSVILFPYAVRTGKEKWAYL